MQIVIAGAVTVIVVFRGAGPIRMVLLALGAWLARQPSIARAGLCVGLSKGGTLGAACCLRHLVIAQHLHGFGEGRWVFVIPLDEVVV